MCLLHFVLCMCHCGLELGEGVTAKLQGSWRTGPQCREKNEAVWKLSSAPGKGNIFLHTQGKLPGSGAGEEG